MALAPRPTWEPLPEPPGPDPALAQDFQVLAAGDMSPLEAAADLVGVGVVAVDAARLLAEAGAEQLGRDIAAGAVELAAMQAEAAPDMLLTALVAAGEQDAALGQTAVDVTPAWPAD